MMDALRLRIPVSMVDVLSSWSKLSRFPLNMVAGMGGLGRLLLAQRFHMEFLSSHKFVRLLLGTPAPCKLIPQTWASLRRLRPSFLMARAKWEPMTWRSWRMLRRRVLPIFPHIFLFFKLVTRQGNQIPLPAGALDYPSPAAWNRVTST